MHRRDFIAGGLSLATTSAKSQFAIFQVAAASSASPGGMGTPQLQVAGAFSTGNRSRDAKDFYTPGNEIPAVSTSDYYHMHACQFLRPYDLDAMGTPGATVKAANGGNRYAWIISGEHPEGGTGIHADSWGFKIGFSNDPGILPSVMVSMLPMNNQWTGDASTPGANGHTMFSDMAPSSFIYNPDDASFPFYLYTQGLPLDFSIGTQSVVWKSSDLFDWVGCAWGPKSTVSTEASQAPLTSFQLVFRHGTGNWSTFGIVGHYGYMGAGQWVGTDGKTWTYADTVYNITGQPTVNLSINAGSGTPNRLTAASAIFSPSDDGKGVLSWAPGDSNSAQILSKISYISTTQIDLVSQSTGGPANFNTFSNAVAPLEFGPISLRTAPAPGIVGGVSPFGLIGAWGVPFTIGSQLYQVVIEDARHAFQPTDDGMWVSFAPIDANFNVSQTVPAIRVSSKYSGIYSGTGYLISVVNYQEDGIIHVYAEVGYPGPHATAATPYVGATIVGGLSGTTFTVDSIASGGFIPIGGFVAAPASPFYVGQIASQSSGTPNGAGVYVVENTGGITIAQHTSGILVNSGTYNQTSEGAGRFDNQFIDYSTVAIDSAAASDAAPFGVSASCSNNTVTISWMNTPLGTGAKSQSYNVYRGSSGTQATLIGNTSSLSITDTPTPNQQWWYKVMKVSAGVETKSRVVHIYVG